MNDFHIYEVIGRGKHSVVYKGRQKKTINYFGVKSIDKGQRPFVLQEVKILHAVKHPNILKFYSWYETSNHLWLILEYCVGGDLRTLLAQDVRLPESSVHDFGRDLLSALHVLHHQGVVHCDLKPSNVLFDENGRVKLGGFHLAKRLSDIKNASPSKSQKNSASSSRTQNPLASLRGTPCYMAPELFQDGSCASFASDIWAFGCILFELATGSPPFFKKSDGSKQSTDGVNKESAHQTLAGIVKAIIRADFAQLEKQIPSNVSEEFKDIIKRCLNKNPVKRITWKEIISHPFWKSQIELKSLPKQPVFDAFVQRCSYTAKVGGLGGEETDIASDRQPRQTRNGTASPSQSHSSSPSQSSSSSNTQIDVMRLSRIAVGNLDGDGDGIDGDGELKLDDADTELDFSSKERSRSSSSSDEVGDEVGPSKTSPTDKVDKLGRSSDREASSPPAPPPSTKPAANLFREEGEKKHPLARGEDVDEDGRDFDDRGQPHSPRQNQQQHQQRQHLEQQQQQQVVGEKSAHTAFDLAFHPSDLTVKPIVGNRRVEKHQVESPWDTLMLPFKPVSLGEMLALDQDSLEEFLSVVYRSVASSPSVSERLNVLSYFESLCRDSNSANIMINSSLMHMFVTKLRASKVANLKVQFASTIGTLVRHATFIGRDVPKTGIVDALTEAVRDKNENVRRKSMAALGELLFYIVTQEQEELLAGDNNAGGDGEGGSIQDQKAGSSSWYIPNGTTTTICRLLRTAEDPVTQHYAVKTLENVFTVGGDWASRLGSHETALSLVHICTLGRSESLKTTASSALARLFRCNFSQVQAMTDKIGIRTIIGFLDEGNAKVQQSFATVLIMSLDANCSNKTRNALSDQTSLIATLVHLLDHGSPVIRGKALICIIELSKLQVHWFVKACQMKLLNVLERLQKAKDEYIYHCLTHAQASMATIAELLQVQISEWMDKLCTRRTSAHGVRTTSTYQQHSSSTSVMIQNLNAHCVVLLGVATSSLFRSACCTETGLIESLASWVRKLRKGMPPQLSDAQNTVFNVIEAISQQGDILLYKMEDILHLLVPMLCANMTDSHSGDIRFLCAKLLCDMVLFYISEMYTARELSNDDTFAGPGQLVENKELLRSKIAEELLPKIPALLRDEDPVPLYALKMLNAVLDFYPVLTAKVAELGMVESFCSYLSLDHPNNNVHNLRLCRTMAVARCVPVQLLLGLDVVHKAGTVLCYACENAVEAFIEPSLELCMSLISRILKDSDDNGSGDKLPLDGGRHLQGLYSSCAHVFRTLSRHSDRNVSEMSMECISTLEAWMEARASQ